MEDSGHPVALAALDGGQFDGVARGNAEAARGDLGEADIAIPQTLPEPVSGIGRLIDGLAVPIARRDADDLSR